MVPGLGVVEVALDAVFVGPRLRLFVVNNPPTAATTTTAATIPIISHGGCDAGVEGGVGGGCDAALAKSAKRLKCVTVPSTHIWLLFTTTLPRATHLLPSQ